MVYDDHLSPAFHCKCCKDLKNTHKNWSNSCVKWWWAMLKAPFHWVCRFWTFWTIKVHRCMWPLFFIGHLSERYMTRHYVRLEKQTATSRVLWWDCIYYVLKTYTFTIFQGSGNNGPTYAITWKRKRISALTSHILSISTPILKTWSANSRVFRWFVYWVAVSSVQSNGQNCRWSCKCPHC